MVLPDIPGESLSPAYEREKIRHVANLMHVHHNRFPGAQPVSFSNEHFSELENENYFVSEKADGVRCLLFLCKNIEGHMEAFLIDRKNKYKFIRNLWFPLPNDKTFTHFHSNTIIDGELVLDELEDGTQKLRFLIFDLVVYEGDYLAGREYSKRLGYLTKYILTPYNEYLKYNPEYAKHVIFSVELKKLHLSYRMNDVFEEQKLLKHKSDGLIFTSESSPYISGNCNKMLKWKPIRENSVDFKLHYLKPENRFTLNIWKGENEHAYFADLTLDPEIQKEWEENPPEGKIVECYFEDDRWHFMRIRNDKENGNHESIVKKILKSIEDNVEKEELLEHTQIIRNNWKQRDIDKKRGVHHHQAPPPQHQKIPNQQQNRPINHHLNNKPNAINNNSYHSQKPNVNSKEQEKYRSNIYNEMLSNEINKDSSSNSRKRKNEPESDEEETFSFGDENNTKKLKN